MYRSPELTKIRADFEEIFSVSQQIKLDTFRITWYQHLIKEIMQLFGLAPCREVGSLKSALKDAILDGEVPNEHEAALEFIVRRAAKMGLHPKS